VMIICNTIAATIGQCFLMYRYYGLSRNGAITALIILTIVTHCTFSFICAIGSVAKTVLDHDMITTAAYCFSASVDIFIPMLLFWELRRIKTTYSCTRSLIHHMIIKLAATGCCVALCEILILMLFWTASQAISLVNAALGPLYGVTVLVNMFVWQQKACPTSSQTNTGELTTSGGSGSGSGGSDSLQRQQYDNPPPTYELEKVSFKPALSEIKSSSSQEISSSDYLTSSSSRPSARAI